MSVLMQTVPPSPYKDGNQFPLAYASDEGGVWWDTLTREQWKRLEPYEGRTMPVNLILMVANSTPRGALNG